MSDAVTSVIFDLDGTLLDSEPLYGQAATRVCARYGAAFSEAIRKQIMGGDTMVGARFVVDTLKLPITPEDYIAQRERELSTLWAGMAPMPGAEALIARLAERGVKMAIATSGHRAVTDEKLAVQPFLAQIAVRIHGDDPRLVHGKPAPDIFLLAARDLGVEPAHCVVIEDSVNGVRAGRAAGMRTVALFDARFAQPREHYASAHAIVDDLAALSFAVLGLDPAS